MKIIYLPAFAVTLIFTTAAYAEINCGTLPSCESLGFTQTKTECPDKYQICPFDKNKVVCVDGPAVGDVKHSLKSDDHDGWLLCNGKAVSRTDYSLLYSVIGTKFGSGTNSSTFNLPDYRGFFLRGAGSNSNLKLCKNGTAAVACTGSVIATTNTSIYPDPQEEELPNIYGSFVLDSNATGSGQITNAFSVNNNIAGNWSADGTGTGCKVTFSAASTSGTGNGVYKASGHVTPPNYATYIFIYAGQ